MRLKDFLKVWHDVTWKTYVTNENGTKEYFNGSIHNLKKSEVDQNLEVVDISVMDDCLFISVKEEN